MPFAIAFSCFMLTLAFLWWRLGVHNPDHRHFSNPYGIAFLVATLLFGASVFLPVAIRPYVWSGGVLFALVLPLITLRRASKKPKLQNHMEVLRSVSPSLIERFGLFTIIVLGEVIVGAVSGLSSSHHLTWNGGLLALLGVLIAVGLWWVYFDFVSHRKPNPTDRSITSWIYLHLPFTASVAAVGAAVLDIVEHEGHDISLDVTWLLSGSVALALLCVSLLNRTIAIRPELAELHRAGARAMFISAILVAVSGAIAMPALARMGLILLLLLVPVYFGLQEWIRFKITQPAEGQH